MTQKNLTTTISTVNYRERIVLVRILKHNSKNLKYHLSFDISGSVSVFHKEDHPASLF